MKDFLFAMVAVIFAATPKSAGEGKGTEQKMGSGFFVFVFLFLKHNQHF